MPLDPRPLGRSLLAMALVLGCSPLPSEVDTSPNGPSTGPGDETTAGTGPVPVTMSGTADSGEATLGGTEDTGPSFDPVCGDGIVEAPEECDLGELNGSGMYCTDLCTSNVCGDGYVGPGEACDDGNQSNADLCTTDCGPTTCGDGVVQNREQCDEGEKNSETGACLPSCQVASCGDGFIQQGVETCDGADIAGESCATQGFDEGVLVCAANCMGYDTNSCYACGNDVLEEAENCDGSVYAGNVTCSDFAPGGTTPSGGSLACTNNCTDIDSSGCFFCGDGVREGAEACDGDQFGNNDCSDFTPGGTTPSGGALACSDACTIDDSGCSYCGDNVIEGDEECESGMLGGETCESQGFDDGVLACTGCTFNTSNCSTCGNGIQEGSEECDGTDLNGANCSSPAAAGAGSRGDLSCAMDCTFDTSLCCRGSNQPCTGNGQCCSGNCQGNNTCN